MIRLSLFFSFWTLTTIVFSQTTIVTGEWTSKQNSNDTISLQKGVNISKDTHSVLSRSCETQDTTFYWHFRNKQILEIEIVIRSCSNNWTSKHDSDSLIMTKSNLTEYESIGLTPKEIKLSLWDMELGEWKINNSIIEITKTKSFNGTYYLIDSDGHNDLKLIRRKASR